MDILLPITLIFGIVYAIRVVVEARTRRQLLLAADGSTELANALLRDQERQRRLSSLRWGIVLIALAFGFGLIHWLDWKEVSPGLVAVLAGATGIGHLVFYFVNDRRALTPHISDN
ncbi:MAG: DUF6249 domain-containing protein [Pseudomonadota bacterium]